MTAVTANGETGAFWCPSAALLVAHGPTKKRSLAATGLAAICAFTLLLGLAGPVSAATAPNSETGVATQTDLSATGVGAEPLASPVFFGANSVYGYDGVLGCCVAPIQRLNGELLDVVSVGAYGLSGASNAVSIGTGVPGALGL